LLDFVAKLVEGANQWYGFRSVVWPVCS